VTQKLPPPKKKKTHYYKENGQKHGQTPYDNRKVVKIVKQQISNTTVETASLKQCASSKWTMPYNENISNFDITAM